MAANYIVTNPGLADAQAMREAIQEVVNLRRSLFGARIRLIAVRDRMVQMRDGNDNAGDPTNYSLVQSRFGTADNASARKLFLETDSVVGKLVDGATGGGTTITSFLAALDQLEAETQA